MRLFAVLVALCALSAPAPAQTPVCNATPDVDGMLVCHDRAPGARKLTAAKPAAAKPAAPVSAAAPAAKPNTEKYVDTISAEDVRMNAQLKNICRGC